MNRFYHVAPVWPWYWCLPCLVSRDRDIKSYGHRRQPWCPIQHPLTMKDHEHWAFDPHQRRSQPHSIPKVLSLSFLGTPFWTAGDLWKKAPVVRTGWKKSRSLGCIAISAPSSKSRKALEKCPKLFNSCISVVWGESLLCVPSECCTLKSNQFLTLNDRIRVDLRF